MGPAQGVLEHTWVVDDGKFTVCLLDLNICGRGLNTQGVVIGGVDNHLQAGALMRALSVSLLSSLYFSL